MKVRYGSVVPSSTGVTITFNGGVCCGQQPGPNLAAFPQTSTIKVGSAAYTLTYSNYGGDNTGAVLLSPFIKPGNSDDDWLQPLLDVTQHRGYLRA